MANEFKVKKGLIVDGSGTVVDIQGTAGQLFSVTDSLTGDLFSVSDVSGIPIFNVNSSGLSTFDGDVTFEGDITINGGDITIAKQNDAPTMTLLHDGTNPSTNDLLFKMQFQSDYNGSHQNWGKIELDTNASSVRTNMDFYVKSASGNEQLALRLEGQPSVTPNAIFEGQISATAGGINTAADVNSTGDKGLAIHSGARLGFDESGTRSWSMKAAGGNLNVFSGDTNGGFNVSSLTNGVITDKVITGSTHLTLDTSITSRHLLVKTGSTTHLTIHGNDSSSNFEGHVKIASSKYLEFAAMGKLINMDVPGWSTGNQEHNLLYSGWTSNTGDYLSVKVAGNSTSGHGNLIIGDNGLWYGTMDTENTAQAADSATNPNGGSNRFRVDSSGSGTFAGDVDVTDTLKVNQSYQTSNEYVLIGKNTANDGGIVMSSKSGSDSATNDWQIVNQGTNRDLHFYAYGLAANALILDRETGHATFRGNVDIYTQSGSAEFNIGRNGAERLQIYQDDNNTTLTADNDSDSNGSHEFRLNRTFEGTGANNFVIQKDGTDQVEIDKNANATFYGDITAITGDSHSFLTGNTSNLSTADTTGFRLHQSSYTDGKYTHRFRKKDMSGGVPLYLDFSSGTANVFANLVRFGRYSGEVHDVEVNGNIKATFANTTGYQIAGTYIVDSSRNLVNINNATASQLTIDDYIYHAGDPDTYIYFTTDNIKLRAGGDDRLELANTYAKFSNNVSISTSSTPRYQLDLAKLNDASQTDYLALGVNNGPSGGGGTAFGTGLVWKANYSGYTKRSAGIVQTAEGNYFRSGLAFFTNNQASASSDWVERMRLNMDGKLTLDPGAGVATDGTVLDVQGSEGQLFSVTNSLTGDLFSVADVSGVPILSVKDNGYVCIDDNLLLKGAIYHNNNPQASTSIYDSQSFFGFASPNAMESDIFFYVGGMTRMRVKDDGVELMDELKTHEIIPDSDSTRDIGTSSVRYRNIYADTLYGDGSNLSGISTSDSTKLPLAGGTMSGDIDLGAAVNASIKKTAGGANGNFAAVEVFSSGTADSGAAIAIQQQSNEGDTIIFADYEPHVEWGISAENNSNEIHFTAGNNTGSLGTKTFRNNSGTARTAYKKVVIDLAGANVSIGNTLSAAGACSFLTNGNGSADFNYITGSEGCKIEANDATVSTFRVDSDRWRVWMGGSGNSQETLTVTEAGRVGVKKYNPAYPLDVTGTIRATSDVIAFSDKRVKENIKTIDNALDKVTKLRGVNYNRKDIEDKSTKIGVIAQEIEKIIPEVVTTDEEGMKSVSYGNVVGVLIEAIKELKSEVEQLKKQIK